MVVGENTSMSYYFTNNNVSSNGGNGIYLYIDPSDGNEIMKIIFMQGNTVSLNTGDGVHSYVNGTDPAMFIGDLGGYGGDAMPAGYVISTGGNIFTLNGGWDINHDANTGLDLWALGNTWTNPSDPQSTITGTGKVITGTDLTPNCFSVIPKSPGFTRGFFLENPLSPPKGGWGAKF